MRIGELRSLLPPNVPMMALTATANAKLRKTIARIIGMKSPRLIYASPCKPNLVYRVLPYESIEVTFEPLLNAIHTKREHPARVIIYCRQYRDCSDLYAYFKRGLGDHFTYPSDAPDKAGFRMIDMYVSCTDEETKSL